MTVVNIKPSQLGPALLREAKRGHMVVMQGALGAARRYASLIADVLDSEGITYQGMMKNRLKVRRTATGAVVTDDAPHAGIIELGARPHPVSREGVEAIARWVKTKLHAVSGPVRQRVHGPTGRVENIGPRDLRKNIRVQRSGPVLRVQKFGPVRESVRYTKSGMERVTKGPGEYVRTAGAHSLSIDQQSLSIAYAIAEHIKVHGAKPRYVFKRHLPLARVFFAEEIERLLRRKA